MGKLMDYLQKQLKSEEYKKDAEDCLKIYEKIKEMNNGKVWSSQWQQLVDVRFKGFPSDDRTYKPSKLGYVFLKGIDEKKEREAGVHYISVQMAIISHLSDAQELKDSTIRLAMLNGRISSVISRRKIEINNHINFAKQLVLTYPDASDEVTNEELNELWEQVTE